MRLRLQLHDMGKVRVVNVRVDSEKSFENDLDDIDEVGGEGRVHGLWEEAFVVDLVLDPGHQVL